MMMPEQDHLFIDASSLVNDKTTPPFEKTGNSQAIDSSEHFRITHRIQVIHPCLSLCYTEVIMQYTELIFHKTIITNGSADHGDIVQQFIHCCRWRHT